MESFKPNVTEREDSNEASNPFEGKSKSEIKAMQYDAWEGGGKENFYQELSQCEDAEQLSSFFNSDEVGIAGPANERAGDRQVSISYKETEQDTGNVDGNGEPIYQTIQEPEFIYATAVPRMLGRVINELVADPGSLKRDLLDQYEGDIVAYITTRIEEDYTGSIDSKFKETLRQFLTSNEINSETGITDEQIDKMDDIGAYLKKASR